MKPIRLSPYRKRGVHVRRRVGWWARAREYMWPSMGLKAFGLWMLAKLLRQAHDPHYVARGAAIGIVVTFFPIIGIHVLLIGLLCIPLRASFVAGMLTSLIGNPYTFPFIWAASFEAGNRILGRHHHAFSQPHIPEMSELWQHLSSLITKVLLPTTVGGFALAIPTAAVAYVIVYKYLRLHPNRARGMRRAGAA